MSDRPDFTLPVSIVAYTIETLPVDIVAQAIGNIGIDIKAQTIGNIDINIAGQDADININIAASAVTIDIQGKILQTNIGSIYNGSFEEDLLGWIEVDTNNVLSVTETQRYHGKKSIMHTQITTYTSHINQLLEPTLNTNEILDFRVAVRAANAGDGWEIKLFYTDGTTDTITLDVTAANTWEVKTITYDADKYISRIQLFPHDDAWTDGTVYVDDVQVALRPERAIIGTVDIDITAQTVGNIDIDIKAQTVGNLDVNIAASAVTMQVNIYSQSANLEIDIKAQTVDLDIKTSGGTNIIIDKLLQDAYTNRYGTLTNRGTVDFWTTSTGNNLKGKFFSRGAKGWLKEIAVYCKNDVAVEKTITVYVGIQPNMGCIYSSEATIAASQSETDKKVNFDKFWNYDSLFIWVVTEDDNIKLARDSDQPEDMLYTTDGGVTWEVAAQRMHYYATLEIRTVGEIPVSGIINAIKMPSTAAGGATSAKSIPDSTLTSVVKLIGSGTVLRIGFYTAHDAVEFRIYIDDVLLPVEPYMGGYVLSAEQLQTFAFTPDSPQIQLQSWTEDLACVFTMTIPYEFKRSVEIKAYHEIGVAKVVNVGIHANMTR